MHFEIFFGKTKLIFHHLDIICVLNFMIPITPLKNALYV